MRYGKFFRDLGKKTYAFYDKLANAEIVDEIANLFDGAWQLQQTGIEYLLADEVTIAVLRKFLKQASKWDDYPRNSTKPELYEYEPDLKEAAVRDLAKRVLRARKGSGYAGRLVELCKSDDLPTVIVEALEKISEALPDSLAPPNDDEEDDNDVFG